MFGALKSMLSFFGLFCILFVACGDKLGFQVGFKVDKKAVNKWIKNGWKGDKKRCKNILKLWPSMVKNRSDQTLFWQFGRLENVYFQDVSLTCFKIA